MKYPALVVDTKKFKHNIEVINRLTKGKGVNICAVTKCFCAFPEVTKLYVEAGVWQLADSRVENLKKITYAGVRKWLLRLPMISEAAEVVLNTHISLNSEIKTVKALGVEAVKLGVKHGIVMMVDLGDLREGVLIEDAVRLAGEFIAVDGIDFLGIGSNLNCYGGIIPTEKNIGELVKLAEDIEKKYNVKLSIISGGNSGSLYMLSDNKLPKGVNNLRLGEVIFIGEETSYQQHIEGLNTDIFTLETQIIELKEKPSVPIGEMGLNAFGEKPFFEDKGKMIRAIVACGRQDVAADKISPINNQIEIIGSSSDHMILDVTHSDKKYQVGDIISFNITYGALLSLSTSEYIAKVYK